MRVSNVIIKATIAGLIGACVSGCAPEPARVEISPDKVVLDGPDATQKLEAKVFDKDGKDITKDMDVIWFTEDTQHIKLGPDGTVKAVASGEADVEAEVVGTGVKGTVSVRVKIAGSIVLSHERLRLWTGQVKDNVWAEVHSEKDAFVEGFLPDWTSDDPDIVKVEAIKDPGRRQSWVKMTGVKSGTAYVYANFRHLSKRIRVAVYDEDEEILPDGTRASEVETKKAAEAAEEAEEKKFNESVEKVLKKRKEKK